MMLNYTSITSKYFVVRENLRGSVASNHGGILIAVNKHVQALQLNIKLPLWCVAVLVQLETPIILCTYYNAPKNGSYTYTSADFTISTSFFLLHKHTLFILCDDMNFPQTN